MNIWNVNDVYTLKDVKEKSIKSLDKYKNSKNDIEKILMLYLNIVMF